MQSTEATWQYRSRSARVFFWVFAPLLALGYLDVNIRQPNPYVIAASSVSWIALVFGAWRFQSSSVIATSGGVTLRNIWRTFRLQWDEVRGFSFGRYGLNAAIGLAWTTHERAIPITAIQAPPLRPNSKRARRALDAIDHLNADLAGYQQAKRAPVL